jgi:hypothetical protein
MVYKLSEEKNMSFSSCFYTWNFLLSLIKLDGGLIQMDKNNSSGIIAERNSEEYEEIMRKLIELLIYLRQEVNYYEN